MTYSNICKAELLAAGCKAVPRSCPRHFPGKCPEVVAERPTPSPGTGTTASAAGTIKLSRYKWHPEGMLPLRTGGFYLAADVDQWGAALAEEARREVLGWRLDELLATHEGIARLNQSYAAGMHDGKCLGAAGAGTNPYAQRTAGGDAVAQCRKCDSDLGEVHHGDCQLRAERIVSQASVYQSEAAAAAQADDADWMGKIPHAFSDLAAAPTAQPTPRPAANAGRNAAQPTPDEIAERASTSRDLASMTKIDASMSREEMSATVKGMFAAAQPTPSDGWRKPELPPATDGTVTGARRWSASAMANYGTEVVNSLLAALRQPGALPDEAEDAQKFAAAIIKAEWACDFECPWCGAGGVSRPTPHAADCIVHAARALAAKQAGKEA